MTYPPTAAPQLTGPPMYGNGAVIQSWGRDKISWGKEIRDYIDMAVQDECTRVRVATRYLPNRPVPDHTTTVPDALVDIVVIASWTGRSPAWDV
jgi:hypothetical protein